MDAADRTLLGRNKLFRDVDMESVAHVLERCQVIALDSGEKLLEIGQKNKSLFLVLDGELHVYLDSRDLTEHVVLGAGECVGELSLIDGGNSSALVIAARDTRLLAVPHEQVWKLVDNLNGVARNLLGILAGRIRNDNLLLVTSPEHSLEFDVAANVDVLTGLHNRRWMEMAFPRMIQRCQRGRMPLCMLMLDIDRFKDFSIIKGHLVGDSVLKMVARVLAEKLRTQDLLACLGVDSFVILLPETPPDGAMRIAERLREAVAETSNAPHISGLDEADQDARITISIGVAAMQPGDSLELMFAAAEDALNLSKATGRNRVEMAASNPIH